MGAFFLLLTGPSQASCQRSVLDSMPGGRRFACPVVLSCTAEGLQGHLQNMRAARVVQLAPQVETEGVCGDRSE